MKQKKDKIHFFKKIYFSICKIKEYRQLSKEGLKKSFYYIMDLLLIGALLYSSILTLTMKNNANELQKYLEENFPNLTYEENILISDNKTRIVLDDQLVKANFGGQVIIDTITDYDTLINEYKTKGEPTILLITDKYITINSQGDIFEYSYNEIINTESKEQIKIDKEYFINLFSNISYKYYFFGYLIGSAIGTSIVVYLYNLLITLISFIVCKFKNIKTKFGEIYTMGLYAHTISVFGYFIIGLLPAAVSVYVQLLIFLIPIGYLGYAIYLNKWKLPE